jgi:hypothetical protein
MMRFVEQSFLSSSPTERCCCSSPASWFTIDDYIYILMVIAVLYGFYIYVIKTKPLNLNKGFVFIVKVIYLFE